MRTLFGLLLASLLQAAPPAGPAQRVPFAEYRDGLSPEEAVKVMSLPPGFRAEALVTEPRVVQPIAMCFDERGRLWVAEGRSYPRKRPDGQGTDRILILEDEKGDGSYSKTTVFIEGLNLVSGLEVGHGGVWVGQAPELLFIPKDAQDRAGKPRVLLDGWGSHDTHETLNSFMWGPDGWLYGCHGVFTHSVVGRPGTPDAQRTKINAGVWRYHPTRHVFEVFAEGSSNAWGLDYNARGDFFITACVIPHLYHVVPGARYQRQAGQHFNPFTYDDIRTIADHSHFAGRRVHRPEVAKIDLSTDESGGGHAHSGLALYQGDNFPPAWRGALIFGNLHGHRLVTDLVTPKGSGYVGGHGPDFLRSNDARFIPVAQRVGPDGALYVADWSDKQVCHNNTTEVWDRTNGRIYRVSHGALKARPGDLGRCSDHELSGLALDDANETVSRLARRVLAERAAAAPLSDGALASLRAAFAEGPSPRRLRALWTLHLAGAFDDVLAGRALADADADVRAWGVRLTAESHPARHPLLAPLAAGEGSPVVRRELASALQRLPLALRADVARPLLARADDAQDHNIPMLLWYGIEPLVGADPVAGLALASACRMERVTEFIFRRLSADAAARGRILGLAADSADAAAREALVRRVVEGVRQSGSFTQPEGWAATLAKLRADASAELAADLHELNALAGDEASRAFYRGHLADARASVPARRRALSILVQARDRGAGGKGHAALAEKELDRDFRRALIESLASVGDADSPAVLLGVATTTPVPDFRTAAVAGLASSAPGGRALLQAVSDGKAVKSLLTPIVVRQLKTLGDADVDALLAKVVGTVNRTKAGLEEARARYQAMLKPDVLRGADFKDGQQVFLSTCGVCHTFGYIGNAVGPGLAGANLGKLDYILENVLDPNAVIGKDYQLNVFRLKNGSTLTGIVQFEDAQSFRLVLPGAAKFTVAKAEVVSRDVLPVSMMPEGLFDALPPKQVINLVAYLQNPDGPAPNAVAWTVPGAVEGESMKVLAKTGGNPRNQPMGGFKASRWSGNDHLWWTGGKPGDVLTVALPVKEKGRHRLTFVFTKAHDYGVFEVALDGRPLFGGPLDFYESAQVVTTGELDAGEHELEAGEHRLTFKILAPNPAATPKHMLGLDFIKVERK
ncbi:MAG: PVC-type heme-binding CxxCH protein [Opitutia bacterium]